MMLKTRILRRLVEGVALLLMLAPLAALAQASAHEVVRDATERVMAVVREAPAYVEEDPDRYYREIQAILDPVIDFRGFARGVMGPYASSARYRSLDEAGKAQLVSQLDRFTEVMREGMVRTYSKGLLAFGGSRIELSNPDDESDGDNRASVKQLIYSDSGDPHMVMYQMGLSRDGQWMLRNMIIESINLGEIYQSQFEAAARKHNGDLDEVIENWSTEQVDPQVES